MTMWNWRKRSDEDFAEEVHAHIAQETKRLIEEEGLISKVQRPRRFARSVTLRVHRNNSTRGGVRSAG